MQICPDRLEDSRKGEETADSLSNRVFDREPHSDRDAKPDQTRPENQQRDLAFKRSIHHHCSQCGDSNSWPYATSPVILGQTKHQIFIRNRVSQDEMLSGFELITPWGEKGRDLAQSYDQSPYTDRKIQKATWQHKNATKTWITQRLRTYLGRSPNWCG